MVINGSLYALKDFLRTQLLHLLGTERTDQEGSRASYVSTYHVVVICGGAAFICTCFVLLIKVSSDIFMVYFSSFFHFQWTSLQAVGVANCVEGNRKGMMGMTGLLHQCTALCFA